MLEEITYTGHYRAGVFGHTGQGNYGHGLDMAFGNLPNVTVVAVADPDEAGRQVAIGRAQGTAEVAPRGYADYRELLETERLDALAVGPHHLAEREAMLLAAIDAGVKAIFTEKPFAISPASADRVLAAAAVRGTKIAVAHQNRVWPGPRLARQVLESGKLGRLRAIKAYGKQDRRGGGQDLMVLGTHMLDLMRWLVGDARWCNAHVSAGGHDATPADVVPGESGVGPVVGDDIVAHYGFDGGVTGSYESMRAGDGGKGNYFRIELCGTDGVVSVQSTSRIPPVHVYPRPFALPDQPGEWEVQWPETPAAPADGARPALSANQLIVADLLAAYEENRKPLSGGEDARAALEMIMAVYASHISGNRVTLPLAQREHPLEHWG